MDALGVPFVSTNNINYCDKVHQLQDEGMIASYCELSKLWDYCSWIAGNNSQSLDIVRTTFESVQPISHQLILTYLLQCRVVS